MTTKCQKYKKKYILSVFSQKNLNIYKKVLFFAKSFFRAKMNY